MSREEELGADSMMAVLGVGDRLKAQREARGLSLDEVSQTLKVSRRVVEQVEANAWTELPGYTFARGIVRGYAKFVQLDPDALLQDLTQAPMPKQAVLDLPRSTRAALPVPGQTQRRDRWTMIAGVALVAGSVLAYFLIPEDWLMGGGSSPVSSNSRAPVSKATVVQESSSTIVSPVVTVPAAPGVEPAPVVAPIASSSIASVAATTAVAPGPAPALVIRFNEMSWVEIKDRNGVMLLSENVVAGSERTLNSEAPLSLALGNAEGVRVTFRGQTVDLVPHTRQKVARLTLE